MNVYVTEISNYKNQINVYVTDVNNWKSKYNAVFN